MQKHMTRGNKKKSADMGSMPMFEYHIWINNMRDLVRNLTNYGLYPIVNPNCNIIAPQFWTLWQYVPADGTSDFTPFRQTWEAVCGSIT